MENYNVFTTDCSAQRLTDQNISMTPHAHQSSILLDSFLWPWIYFYRYLALVSAFSLSKIKKGEREHEHSKAIINYIDFGGKQQINEQEYCAYVFTSFFHCIGRFRDIPCVF